MTSDNSASLPEVVTEAIVVIDLVESTLTSNLFGWYSVGRQSLRDLRSLINEVGMNRGLRCLKSTGTVTCSHSMTPSRPKWQRFARLPLHSNC